MKKSEIIFIVLLVGGLLVPVALVGQWWLFAVFCVFFVCFGVVEFLAVKFSNRSVSQKFWDWSKDNKGKALAVLGFMLVAWLALLWHLGAKIFYNQ